LFELSKTIKTLTSIENILEWDQETYMPSAAVDFRAAQKGLMAGHVHKLKTSTKYSHLLNQLIDLESGQVSDPSLTPAQCAALREWRRDHLKDIKIPASFVKTFISTCAIAGNLWIEAKKTSNFSLFAPSLTKILQLSRKKADLLGYQDHPYDALLDLFEPGMTVAKLTPLFDRLKTALTTLVKSIQSKPPVNRECLKGEFNSELQMQFGRKILKAMGFTPEDSRLDLSVHPFCTPVHPLDTRMTTRTHHDDIMSNVFSVVHEGGHGLYNKGLNIEQFGSPLGEQSSLGIDESQSRWWETRIARTKPFWTHFLPLLQRDFPQLQKAHLDQFYSAINEVRPSFIRVEADEVTYSLHVIIRFEIEKALIEGSLKVKDLPAVWNQKMHDYLGITPSKDSEGCLQDIHWAFGHVGYFPTYVLGNLYAAQFFHAFEKAHSDWQSRVSKGELGFIREWLHTNIHQYGRQYTPEELVMRISGKQLGETDYVNYLNGKYKEIYHF
ncbi:MAG TPA: carboxypeptidase M32, partial [Rhabdochlamydiaceae bacterium]|nr:carboxypeptidase M32 [Rhabdochlamydiaceae bacterium]